MLHALELLYALGGKIQNVRHLASLLMVVLFFSAIDDDCQLTKPLGVNMAEFPLSPMFARMLLTSG